METKQVTYDMVRTRSGKRIHIASTGSSRTLCGVRVAARVRTAVQGCEFCAQCGTSPETTVETMNERYAPTPTLSCGELGCYMHEGAPVHSSRCTDS